MLIKKIGLLSCIVFLSLLVTGQTVDEVINKYINYIGGEGRWKTVQTIITAGMYNYGGIEFPFKTYSKALNKYKVIVPLKGKYFAQAFDGKKGWKIDAFKNETKKTMLSGKEAKAMMNEADVELESPFIHYQSKGSKAVLEGKDTVAGKECYKVMLMRADDTVETYYFDDKTFALLKKQAISKNSELDNSMLDIYYSNYQVIKGIRVPFQTIMKTGIQTILTIKNTKVDINLPISDASFKP